MICDYGCGQKAIKQFGNGVWCCSTNQSCCPIIKKKISESHITYKNGIKVCPVCNRKKTINEFHNREKTGKGVHSYCKDCVSIENNQRRKRNLSDWRDYFHKKYGKEVVSCQICGKKLRFSTGKNTDSVHFDHHGRGKQIKNYYGPYQWLQSRRVTEKNIGIFEDENFGILCSRCNRYILTDRELRLKLVDYILEMEKKHVGQTQLSCSGVDEGES